jgi:rod shape determining protein RodA
MWMASKMQDTFSRLLTAGLTVSLFTGVIVNIGMISGLLPIVGVPLPFISYGGTSMVVSLISMGIIMNLYSNKSLIAN